MKRILTLAMALTALVCCRPDYDREAGVTAFAVPGTGDFVWENSLTGYCIPGAGNDPASASHGIDVWVKKPGDLVMRDWCWEARRHPERMHDDHKGMGGDFFTVGNGLGAGASALLMDSGFVFPPAAFSSYQILRRTDSEVTFVLHYPVMKLGRFREVGLDKQISISAESRFCKVTDYYSGYFDELRIAAGLPLADDTQMYADSVCQYVLNWNKADDGSMIGTAVYAGPNSCEVTQVNGHGHALLVATIAPDQPFTYYIGSCWSNAGVDSMDAWKEELLSFISDSGNDTDNE